MPATPKLDKAQIKRIAAFLRDVHEILQDGDGDAALRLHLGAHYAYANDYLCTRDSAKSGGANSLFSLANRSWLESKYGRESP